MAKTPIEIKSKARAHTDAAIQVLVEIMEDRAAPHAARVAAATQILNRGLGSLVNETRFGPVVGRYYVYSIHDVGGRLVYIGKGSNRRHLESAQRLQGRSRIRAEFDNERAALAFEARLIKRFRPRMNIVHARTA